MIKRLSLSILLILVSLCFGCKSKTEERNPESKKETEDSENYNKVAMTIKNYGTITIELYPDVAPITVEHFIYLVKNGLYDGTDFIRMQQDFVLQGGANCKNTDTIKGEFSSNGVENNISHTKGIVSMARATDYDSGSSQFFIMLSDKYTSSLDGLYAAFGKIIDGWDVIEKILNDIDSSYFTNDYYGVYMGFFKEDHFIKIEKAELIK